MIRPMVSGGPLALAPIVSGFAPCARLLRVKNVWEKKMYSSSVASIACKVSSENHKKQHFTFLKLWCPRMFVCAELHITLFLQFLF